MQSLTCNWVNSVIIKNAVILNIIHNIPNIPEEVVIIHNISSIKESRWPPPSSKYYYTRPS